VKSPIERAKREGTQKPKYPKTPRAEEGARKNRMPMGGRLICEELAMDKYRDKQDKTGVQVLLYLSEKTKKMDLAEIPSGEESKKRPRLKRKSRKVLDT